MRIEVTQRHIDCGRRGNVSECAVALPIQQLLGPHFIFEVGQSTVCVCPVRAGRNHWYDLPRDVQEFIRTFDDEGPSKVKPISFDLPLEDLLCPSATP